jgi:hypothetical protein
MDIDSNNRTSDQNEGKAPLLHQDPQQMPWKTKLQQQIGKS